MESCSQPDPERQAARRHPTAVLPTMASRALSAYTAPFLAAIAGVVMLGCQDGDRSIGPIELLPSNSIASVIVYTWPWYVQVGDTLHIEAAGYNVNGWSSSDSLRTVAWRSAPSGVVELEALPSPFRYWTVHAVRGLAPGRAIVTATLNGVSGSDSVVVVPRLQAVELSADRTTVHVGATVTITAVIRTTSGATLEGPQLVWDVSDYTRAVFSSGFGRFLATGAGTVDITATIARTTGRTSLTILPAVVP